MFITMVDEDSMGKQVYCREVSEHLSNAMLGAVEKIALYGPEEVDITDGWEKSVDTRLLANAITKSVLKGLLAFLGETPEVEIAWSKRERKWVVTCQYIEKY